MTWLLAIGGPLIVTALLVRFSHQTQRDYVFIYLGLVAVVGVIRGLWPAPLLCGVGCRYPVTGQRVARARTRFCAQHL